VLIVGVAGGTGSGKTTLARTMLKELGNSNAVLIPHDSYYKDNKDLSFEERKNLNYDHPDAFETKLLIDHLKRLQLGDKIEMPTYDYSQHTRSSNSITINPCPVILVEGILVLAESKLRNFFDIKVYVDTDPDIRVLRRISRDISKRGRSFESVREQYLSTVKPMHDAFIEPSKRYADIIVPEGGYNTVALSLLISRLNSYLLQYK